MMSRVETPTLTRRERDRAAIGRKIIEILDNMIGSKSHLVNVEEHFKTKLIVRSST